MFYIVYKTTNKINGKIYIGKHKTADLDDGYLGSGKLLRRAIRKYGVDNFHRVVLYFCRDETEMFTKEAEIVTAEFITEQSNYNLKLGGEGGFDYINSNFWTAETRHNHCISISPFYDRIWQESQIEVRKRNGAKAIEAGTFTPYQNGTEGFKTIMMASFGADNPSKNPASIKKRKPTFASILHQQGSKNSQFGSIWINNGHVCKKLKAGETMPVGFKRGRV